MSWPAQQEPARWTAAPWFVKLQRDAEDVITLALQDAGDDGGIHAARHGDDNARIFRSLVKIQRVNGLRLCASCDRSARNAGVWLQALRAFFARGR